MITFNSIPTDIRTPGVYAEVDNTLAMEGLPSEPHRILMIGGQLSTGTGTSGAINRIVSVDQAELLYGRGSLLHKAVEALRALNTLAECWAVGLSDHNSGVAATGTLVISAPGTRADGALYFLVAGQSVPVVVSSTDTVNTIASNVAAAINAITDLPITATANTSTVSLLARNKGETGNAIDLRLNYYPGQANPGGVACAITAMASGATNPSITSAITAMGDEQFHSVIMPYTDAANLTALEDELERRFGPTVQKEGHGFVAARNSYANLLTLGNSRNSPHVTLVGSQAPTPPWIVAAVTSALDALEPDPARPRQTLYMRGVLAPSRSQQFTRDERDLLLRDGVSTFTVDASGRCLVERLVTTYQSNPAGFEDTSYLDIETMRTLAYFRFAVRSRIASRYPRHKLADDGTRIAPGQAIVTPRLLRAELIGLYGELESRGLVEDMATFKQNMVVERNATDRSRVDAVLPPNLINQFRVFGVRVSFKL